MRAMRDSDPCTVPPLAPDIHRYQSITAAEEKSVAADEEKQASRGPATADPDPEQFQLGVDPFPGVDQFSSIEAWLDFTEAVSRKSSRLPSALPGGSAGLASSDRTGSKQVGLRLPAEDFEILLEIGGHFGVAPATMARILVVRAVRVWN